MINLINFQQIQNWWRCAIQWRWIHRRHRQSEWFFRLCGWQSSHKLLQRFAADERKRFRCLKRKPKYEQIVSIFISIIFDSKILIHFIVQGAVVAQYFIQSDHYVPESTKMKIDQTTSSMMEYGFHRFYLSFAAYKEKLSDRLRPSSDDDDFRPLTIEQLKRPLVVILYIMMMSAVIFVAEVVISKCKKFYATIFP